MILIQPYAQKLRNGVGNPKNYPWWPELLELLPRPLVQIGIPGELPLTMDFRPGLSFRRIQELVRECDFWISVDSFLPHLAFHEAKPGVVLWGPSDPRHFGYESNLNLLRDRKYLRPKQFGIWEQVSPNPEAFLTPIEVAEPILAWHRERTRLSEAS